MALHSAKTKAVLGSPMLSSVFRFVVLGSFLILAISVPALAKGAYALQSRANDCGECHELGKHPVIEGVDSRECAVCHGEQTQQLIATAEAIATTPPQTGASKPPQLHTPDHGPGMSLPQYYADTRLGDHPNEMLLVPAGEFTMGTDTRLSDEGPAHKVSVPGFWIDRYEVTNLQYKKFIGSTGRASPDHFENRSFPEGKADHPVTYVSWYDASAYCEWAGKRLPTDVEWEKAARGSDGRIYPWGNDFDINKVNSPVRWTTLKIDGDTTPVGAFAEGVSPYGAYDMSGNVWEWTASWYTAYPGNTQPNENYGEKYKTLKGGSWWDCSFYKCGVSAPSFNRGFFLRKTKNKSFGFRCAKDDGAHTAQSKQ